MARTLRVFLALVLFLLYPPYSRAAESLSITYTYAKDSFGQLLQEFAAREGIVLTAEFREQNDLKSSILGMMERNTAPDAMIVPADHIGLHAFTNYSKVDTGDFPANISSRIWSTTLSDGEHYGVPLIQGNHLVLFYNKKLVAEPARDWEMMFRQKAELNAKGTETIAWSFDETYWFLPFLGAYGGWPLNNGNVELNTPEMIAALEFYKSLRTRALPYPNCSYQCAVDMFKTGAVAYTINGDWVGKEFHEALGENLGVSAIPDAEHKKMVPTFSTHVLAFPNAGLSGKKRGLLLKLAQYLHSAAVQKQLWLRMGAIPVEESAFKFAREQGEGYSETMINLMVDAKPLPADKEMTFIWDAIGKGFLRHREGALDAPAAARYMQQLAERHIRNAQRLASPEAAP